MSHSVASFLERRGENLEPLYERLEIPGEFLKDPSYWIEAQQMETFLLQAEQLFGSSFNGALLTTIGHKAPELRAWGALDSVLRIMQKPQDIYAQPARFISYFVAPEPPIGNLQRESDSVTFEVPISNDQYPKVAEYLTAALESLPVYIAQPMSQVQWQGSQIHIGWSDGQANLLEEEASKRNFKPELVDTIVQSLEASQRELESKNQELALKNQELLEAKQKLESHLQEKIYSEQLMSLSQLAAGLSHEINNPMTYVISNVHRMRDYMVRAQQVITLMIGQGRDTPQVKEAMRRTDWEYIKTEFPQVVKDAVDGLRKIQDIVKDLSFLAQSHDVDCGPKVDADLNELVDKAVGTLNFSIPKSVNIDRHLFLDRPVKVYPVRIEQALVNLINNAVQAIDKEGSVRIVTRPKGQRAEIEISDTGIGMDSETLERLFTPFFTTKQPGRGTGLGLSIARSIIKMHDGNIHVASRKGEGSTFTIDLPM